MTAFSEVSSTLVAQDKLVDVVSARAKTVGAYSESVRLSLLRYNQGLANYYEVLEAQQLLFPAENALAQSQRDQLLVRNHASLPRGEASQSSIRGGL